MFPLRLELDYPSLFKLTITQQQLHTHRVHNAAHGLVNSTTECYNIKWMSNKRSFLFRDFIYLGDSYWFGGASMFDSYWPINSRKHHLDAFVTADSFNRNYGSIQERFWMSSSGAGLFIDYDVPLFVDINQHIPDYLLLESHFSPPFTNSLRKPLTLNYTLCFAMSPQKMFLTAARNFWNIPTSIPNARLFQLPSWSTWASFKWGISTDVLLEYAHNISMMGFQGNHMVIDDGWMQHYGDFKFSTSSFPEPSQLIKELKRKNFTLSLWLHPFSNFYSSSFWKTDNDGYSYWVHYAFKWLPSLMLWWNGVGAALDLTNEQTIQWFVSELRDILTEYDIDSFKFDAGEASWLPHFKSFKNPLDNPNDYTQSLTRIAQLLDRGAHMQEIRSSVSSQDCPIFVRLIDKVSEWSNSNGLRSIIPQALTVGLIGYPFVLADMIGGNAYYGIIIHATQLPDRELYIRWIQVSF